MAKTANPVANLPTIAGYTLQALLATERDNSEYLATDERLQRKVALRVWDLMDNNLPHALRQGAQLLAQINHPNVIKLYDLVEVPQQLILVTEHVQGTSLAKLQQRQTLSTEQKISILQQISNGIQAIHCAGVLHAQLTAEHIWVTAQGTVKIRDLGLAQTMVSIAAGATPPQLSQQQRSRQQKTGHQRPLSPEQAAGLPLDLKADVFAFGLLAYQLLAGRQPYGSDQAWDPTAVDIQLVASDAAHITSPLPIPLLSLVNACLQRNKHLRPINFAAITAVLHQIEQDILYGDTVAGADTFLDAVTALQLARSPETATAPAARNGNSAVNGKPPTTPPGRAWLAFNQFSQYPSWLTITLLAAASLALLTVLMTTLSPALLPTLAPPAAKQPTGFASTPLKVAILMSHASAASQVSLAAQQQLQDRIEQGLRQHLETQQQLELLPGKLTQMQSTATATNTYLQQARALAAALIVHTYLSCGAQRCIVSLEVLRLPSGGVVAQRQWYTYLGADHQAYLTASQEAELLLDTLEHTGEYW